MKKLIFAALLSALALTAVACTGGDTDPVDTTDTTAAEVTTAFETEPATEPAAEETTASATEAQTEAQTEPETEPETETETETEKVTETEKTTEPETEPETVAPTWQSGDNVALGKYVTASGSAWDGDQWGIDKVTDGSIMQTEFEEGGTNGWMSNAVGDVTGETWVCVDLEHEIPINVIKVYPRQSGERFPTGFYIEASTDGINWTKIVEVTDDPYTLEGRVYTFDTINARYVRLTTTEMHADSYVDSFGGYIAQFSEIEVYAA